MKETLNVDSPTDWNSPVSPHLIDEWGDTVMEAISTETLQFLRSCHPKNAVKLPWLVAFFDGSSQAFTAVLYAVWMVNKDGSRGLDELPTGDIKDEDFNPDLHHFTSQIVSTKARVTPLKQGLTIPRAEMSGLVLASRLQYRVSQIFPEKIAVLSTIGDSTCVISAMDKNATAFNPFMHARVSECYSLRSSMAESSEVEPIQHVESKENIADLCTRKDGRLSNIGPGSLWQTGPQWLLRPRHDWTCCRRDFCRVNFPKEETKHPIRILLTTTKLSRNPWVVIVINKSRTFDEAVNRLARMLVNVRMYKAKILGNHMDEDYPEALDRAKNLLLEDAMDATDALLSEGKMSNLNIESQAGVNRDIHYSVGRFGQAGTQALYKLPALPVISAGSRLAELILRGAHEGEHGLNHRKANDALARS